MSDFRFLLKIVLLALMILVYAIAAQAHSWYPRECCGEGDCKIVDTPKMERKPEGYLINGQIVPFDRVRPSPDGEWHICSGQISSFIFCVFEPKGSV